jgi:hypothetical protein
MTTSMYNILKRMAQFITIELEKYLSKEESYNNTVPMWMRELQSKTKKKKSKK